MNRAALTNVEAFAVCEAIARDHVRITQVGLYADGYRSAAQRIANAIRKKLDDETGAAAPTSSSTLLECDLREAEIEARAYARIVSAAERVVTNMRAHERAAASGAPDAEDWSNADDAADVLRKVLNGFFDEAELPAALRRCDESTTRLMTTTKPTTAKSA